MKIAHITCVHPDGDVRILQKECQTLARAGHEATLIASRWPERSEENVRILRARAKEGGARLFRMLAQARACVSLALAEKYDIYHLHDPILLLFVRKLRKSGAKIVFDAHESVKADILDKPWMPLPARKIIAFFYGLIEKHAAKDLSGVIAAEPGDEKPYAELGVKKTVCVTNYPVIRPVLPPEKERERALCFCGGVKRDWLHENVLAALEKIPDARYILAGPAPEGYLNKLKQLPAWNRVTYLGRVPHAEVENIYARAAVGVALLDYLPSVGGRAGRMSNTKLFEYMEAGLPVVCTDFSLWKAVVDKAECGLCVDPFNEKAVASAFAYLLDHPMEARSMGARGRAAVLSTYNWDTQARILLDFYAALEE